MSDKFEFMDRAEKQVVILLKRYGVIQTAKLLSVRVSTVREWIDRRGHVDLRDERKPYAVLLNDAFAMAKQKGDSEDMMTWKDFYAKDNQ